MTNKEAAQKRLEELRAMPKTSEIDRMINMIQWQLQDGHISEASQWLEVLRIVAQEN